MLELVGCIDDSHAHLANQSTNDFFGRKYIPAKFIIVEEKAIVTGFYNDSLALWNDLKIGDVITKENKKTIQTVYEGKENTSQVQTKQGKSRILIALILMMKQIS